VGQTIQHLVLVPGSLCDARVWQNQARDLGDVATITVANLHGHDSIPAMAEAALAAAPERFALAGFAMGGRVALEMVRRAPERITRLALIDSSVHQLAPGEAERRQPQIELARREGMIAFARWWNPQIVHSSRREEADYMGLLEAMADSFTPAEYEREVRALLNRPDAAKVLGGISVPTLVLYGTEDMLSGPARNRQIAEAIPHARLVAIEGTGHFPLLEKPEQVTAAMREWLAA
jgi:pimeloyl-ACP methyl ester carboxylesterase